jgi:NAD(P)-dependent dehydrogenase (short-subunit alcohol dehydrogenase family)
MSERVQLTTDPAEGGRLAGKRVLITGTGGGQGAVAQELFAKHGAHVIGCDVRPGTAAATAAALTEQGLKAEGYDVDLSDPEAARVWVEQSVATMGGLDVLYNNASRAAVVPFGEMKLDHWRFTLANEMDTVFVVTSAAWPFLIESRGSIINTASALATMAVGTLGLAAHVAAKGGVQALTRQLAVEGAAHGVRVNSVSPSFIVAPGTELVPPHIREHFAKNVNLMGELVECIDVAYCALYLASDESRFVTGSDYVVDAGMLAGHA